MKVISVPRHILGHILLWIGMAIGSVGHGICWCAAYLLDEEEFWKEDSKKVDEHFKEIFGEDE